MKKAILKILIITAVMLIAIPAYAADSDGDGIGDIADNCPSVANVDQGDWNENDIGDACEDFDGDGVMDDIDNCPEHVNGLLQEESACTDLDGDLVMDREDNCIEDYNPYQEDRDLDGVGDVCDNCQFVANTDQADSDDDGFGDECMKDFDGDGIDDDEDNCPTIFNPGQEDSGGTYRGDACEAPDPAQSSVSTDEDGINANVPMGSHGCSLASIPGAESLPANALVVLMLMASAAIISDFRKVRR